MMAQKHKQRRRQHKIVKAQRLILQVQLVLVQVLQLLIRHQPVGPQTQQRLVTRQVRVRQQPRQMTQQLNNWR